MRALVLLAALAAAPAPVAAQDEEVDALAAHRAWTVDTADALARRGDARDAIAAMYLGLSMAQAGDARANDVVRRAWARASAAGGDDPLVLTTAITACPTGPRGCERAAAFSRLAELEPDNGAYWRLALGEALEQRDADRAREALSRMARAERFDTHQGALFAAIDAALASVPLPAAFRTDEEGALVEEPIARGAFALGVLLLAWTGPSPTPFATHCLPGSDPAYESRRADCVAAADRMAQRADTIADEILGARVRYRATPDGPARAAAHAALRDVLWRRDEYARLSAEEGADAARAFASIERRRRHRTERGVAEATLRAARVSSSAPADYVPADPDFRGAAAS